MEEKWQEYARFQIKHNGINKNTKENVHKIFKETVLKNIPQYAIYRIKINDITIPRILGNDSNGILSIGQADKLEERYNQIKTSLTNWNGHSEAILAHYIYTYSTSFYDKYINGKTISVDYFLSKNLNRDETTEIITYIKNFGEPPPFNSSIPDRYNDEIWEKVFNGRKVAN
jgi:hypothetical protein